MPQSLSFHPHVTLVVERFALPRDSVHGPAHWARVLENGLRLAPLTGADPVVVSLFAILHDSCRDNDGRDIHHGPRAAKWLRTLDLDLTNTQHDLLVRACAGHTTAWRSKDPSLATCWDADRLDIGRVGAVVNPMFLSTAAARDPGVMTWAQQRAVYGHVPDFALDYL